MRKPEISIIVPVYNSAKYLHKCIDSILLQTFTDFECILVDDCSSDGCPEICDEYVQKDIRVRVIHNIYNKGSSLARKIGLENALGKYIQFVDSDDWIEPDMAEKLYLKAISENYDITICNFFHYEHDGTRKISKQFFLSYDKIEFIKSIISDKHDRIKVNLFNKLIRRKIFSCVEFPKYSCGEDFVVILQCIYNSNKIGYIDTPLYHYCYNSQSLTKSQKEEAVRQIEENKNWCVIVNYLREKYGDVTVVEPELSNRINTFKKKYIMNKELRKSRELFDLYPESKFFKWFCMKLIEKIIRFIIPYGIVTYYDNKISGKCKKINQSN